MIIEEKFGYSDEVNPFGDTNLSRPFVWEKKEKVLQAKGLSSKRCERETYLKQTAETIVRF